MLDQFQVQFFIKQNDVAGGGKFICQKARMPGCFGRRGRTLPSVPISLVSLGVTKWWHFYFILLIYLFFMFEFIIFYFIISSLIYFLSRENYSHHLFS